jgi:hypothetical protein
MRKVFLGNSFICSGTTVSSVLFSYTYSVVADDISTKDALTQLVGLNNGRK